MRSGNGELVMHNSRKGVVGYPLMLQMMLMMQMMLMLMLMLHMMMMMREMHERV